MEPILNVVLPVFAIIAAGYGCGRFRLLGQESTDALNRFVYWVALPVLLFHAMARVDLARLMNWPFIAAYAGGLLGIWILALVFARVFYGRGLAEGTMHGMNAVYGNTGYMGIPLALAAFGEAAALPAIVTAIINAALVVAIATMLIEIGQKRSAGFAGVALDVGLALVRNPVVVAPVLGIAWAATTWPLPGPVDGFGRILGAAAGPCALFSIGLFLVGKPLREGLGEVGVMTGIKLLLQPAVTAVLALWVFVMDPLWASVAILMATLPTGAGSFVLAQAYGLYVQRTSSVILISTVLSVLTISTFFVLLPQPA